MPAIGGLFLCVAVGRFLQRQRRIVPWLTGARVWVLSSYAITGIVSLIAPAEETVGGTVAVWALAMIPQSMISVAFSVVMGAVAGPRRRYDLLSRREQQVLRLIALGHTNRQVADMLYLSIKTIETYKARLMAKLDLTGRAALVRYALQRGLLEEQE